MSTQPDISAESNSPAARQVNPVHKKLGALFADVAGRTLTRDAAFTYIRDLLGMKHADRDQAILSIIGMFDGQPETQIDLIDRVYWQSRIGDEKLQKNLFDIAQPLLKNIADPSEKLERLSSFFSQASWQNPNLKKTIYQTMVGVLDEFGTAAEKFEAALFVAGSAHHEDVPDYENILLSLALGQDSRIQSFEALKKVYERHRASDDVKKCTMEKAIGLLDKDVTAQQGYDISQWVYTRADKGSTLKARMADKIMSFIGRMDGPEAKFDALKNTRNNCHTDHYSHSPKPCPVDISLAEKVMKKAFSIVNDISDTRQQLDAALWLLEKTLYTALEKQSLRTILSLIEKQSTPRARFENASYVYHGMRGGGGHGTRETLHEAVKRLAESVREMEEKSAPMTPEEFRRFAAGWVEKPPMPKM